MRGSRWFSVICLLFSLCGSSFAKEGWSKNYENAVKEAREKNLPLILQFGFEKCVFCKAMEKNVLSDDRVEKAVKQKFVAAKLELEDNEELAETFQITAFPTTLVLETCEVPILSNEGAQSVDEFLTFLDKATRRFQKITAPRTLEPEPEITGLDGFCPVHFTKNNEWKTGSGEFAANHFGQSYQFTSKEAKAEFLATPESFLPQFRGFDPVEATEHERAALGSPRFGSVIEKKLYLFTSDENRKKFYADPQKYLRINYYFTSNDIELVQPKAP